MLSPIAEPEEDLTALPSLEQVMRLKNGLVARAQSGTFEGSDYAYRTLRRELRRDPVVYAKLPDFVRSCGNLDKFWGFIRPRFPTYQERQEFLRESFAPVLEYLEANEYSPGLVPVGEMLTQFDAETVHAVWQKVLSRRVDDPEGAITFARTLIETGRILADDLKG